MPTNLAETVAADKATFTESASKLLGARTDITNSHVHHFMYMSIITNREIGKKKKGKRGREKS